MQSNFLNNILSYAGKTRRRKMSLGSLLLLIVIGAVFVGVSYPFIRDALRSQGWPTTAGTVATVDRHTDSDGTWMYTPTVTYTIDGKDYVLRSNVSTSHEPAVGEAQTVSYDPANPSNALIRDEGLGPFIYLFPLVGIGLIVGAVIGFIRSKKRTGAINQLKQTGMKTQGILTDVQVSMHGTHTTGTIGSSQIRIVVSATDSNGQVRNYLSDWIQGNAFSLMDYRTNPVAIDVYLDPANPDNYYVDIDDIPTLTPDKIMSLLRNVAQAQGSPTNMASGPVQPTPIVPSTPPNDAKPPTTPPPTT